jgi:dTDP-4-amino-4,6-dideoxygalactose transaminase
MKVRGIVLGRYFTPIHLQPAYRTFSQNNSMLPVTEFEAQRSLALPFFNQMSGEQVDEVSERLRTLCATI